MSIYRCAMCGSSKIVPETKQEGYNKKKGVLGAVLFGGVGALAGADGNTVTYYHCGDCGHVLNYCMPEYAKNNIDRYLLEPDNEANKIMLRIEKKQYPNIEWEESTTNSIPPTRINQVDSNKEDGGKIDILSIGVVGVDILKTLYEAEMPCTVSEMQMIDESCKKYSIQQLSFAARYLTKINILEKSIEGNEIYYKPILDSENEAFKLLHKQELEKQHKESKNKKQPVGIAVLDALYEAGKPCTISEMQVIDQSCRSYTYQEIDSAIKLLIDMKIVEELDKFHKIGFERPDKAYFKVIPGSKDEALKAIKLNRKQKLEKHKQESEKSRHQIESRNNFWKSVMKAILSALDKVENPLTLCEMQNIEESCKGYSTQQLSFAARLLVQAKKVERIEKDGKAYFRAITNAKDAL